MSLLIDDSSPIFVQIAERIENDIIEGLLPEETQVPSTNQFASFYQINPATAAKGVNLLVDQGNTVITVEHDMHVIANSDWIVDIGPGAGDEGGKVVAAGPVTDIAENRHSRTAPFLAKYLNNGSNK